MSDNFFQSVKLFGFSNYLLYSCNKLIKRISHNKCRIYKYLLFSQAVKSTPLLPPHRGRDIQVRKISKQDSLKTPFPRPQETIKARFAQNGKCLAAYKNGEMLGYIWLNFGNCYEDEVRCLFSPQPQGQSGWDYDIYILPQHRNGPTFAKLWDAANQFMRENHIRWTMSRISAFNPGSITSHIRLGAKLIGAALFFCIGNYQILVANVAPYIHISTNDNSRPTISLGSSAR